MHRAHPLTVVLGPVVQLSYEVRDVRAAAHKVAETLGAGPFLVAEHPPLRRALDGEGRVTCFDHVSAYGSWAGLQVELVQLSFEVTDPRLRRGGGLHHVAHFCSDLDEASAALAEAGSPLVLDAVSSGGTRFRMHRASTFGHLVEIYESSEGVEALYERVAAAARGWDGSDPVRELPSG